MRRGMLSLLAGSSWPGLAWLMGQQLKSQAGRSSVQGRLWWSRRGRAGERSAAAGWSSRGTNHTFFPAFSPPARALSATLQLTLPGTRPLG